MVSLPTKLSGGRATPATRPGSRNGVKCLLDTHNYRQAIHRFIVDALHLECILDISRIHVGEWI